METLRPSANMTWLMNTNQFTENTRNMQLPEKNASLHTILTLNFAASTKKLFSTLPRVALAISTDTRAILVTTQ